MKTFLFALIILIMNVINLDLVAQDASVNQPKPIIEIRGDETPDLSNADIITTGDSPVFEPVQTSEFTFEIHNITEKKTGYDFQSNASTQQVWVDYYNPQSVHTVFTNSQVATGWADRSSIYFGSLNAGATWFEFGAVPVNNGTTGKSGFPVIYGLLNGAALISNHNNSFGTMTNTKLYSDASQFEYNFTEFDPGNISDGPVWPRLTVTDDSIVIFASSGSPAPDDDLKLNTLDLKTGTFAGWTGIDAADGESYDFSISPSGKVVLVGLGRNTDAGDVWLMQTTNNGISWDPAIKVFDRDESLDTTMGAFNGVQVNFYNEEPCVTFEVSQQIFSSGNFFPGLPSEIHFWSPNINGGVSKVIADSSNVPYYPYVGTNDGMVPICRPVIGRADNGYLFIAFSATTASVFPSSDTTSYMAGFFTHSSDGGENWSVPEKFTPDSPLLDWRYPSIAEIIPVTVTDDEGFTIHIVIQGDSIPGSTVNAAGMPVGVTAQYYHFSADVIIQSADGEIGRITSYKLDQNYPNPFNPNTKIKYSIPSQSYVQIKVYDVLGNEIATLVNEEKLSGSYTVNFDASNIPSGVYFYSLNAGNFTESKKMILMK